MKKRLFIVLVLLAMVLFVSGCGKETSEKEGTKDMGGWSLRTNIKNTIPAEADGVFKKAYDKYTDMKLEPIAYLGSQIVAGTNYMYLCTSDDDFKVVIVYNDLKDNAEITSVKDFDIRKYVNEEIDIKDDELSGGWKASSEVGESTLTSEERAIFDESTKELLGVNYKPVAVLATQLVSGTNYAVLSVAETVTENPTYSVCLLTIYKDLEGKTKVTSVADIDLAEFND